MSYTALYRKFRPVSFKDVKGQDHIITTLQNRLRQTASDMPTCSAEHGALARPRWLKYLRKQ